MVLLCSTLLKLGVYQSEVDISSAFLYKTVSIQKRHLSWGFCTQAVQSAHIDTFSDYQVLHALPYLFCIVGLLHRPRGFIPTFELMGTGRMKYTATSMRVNSRGRQ